MTEDEVLAAALADPDAQPMRPEELAKMRRISPVKALRQRLGMTASLTRTCCIAFWLSE